MIVARALRRCYGIDGWKLWVGRVLVILGLSAIHERIEFASTLALGPEKGMLKTNDPDKFDTQKDLLNNLIGTLVALFIYSTFRRLAKDRPLSDCAACPEPLQAKGFPR